jgi:hydrogenase nickel incorporation protein HypA/HybF
MHELAVCQALIDQVTEVAQREACAVVERIEIAVGALSGVEPALLQRAFTIARAGTVASEAELVIHAEPVRVLCSRCGTASQVPAQRLTCSQCGDWRVQVTDGESLVLQRLSLRHDKDCAPQ